MMIEINNVTKKFGDKIVFENIHLKVHPGTIIGIIGHNGSGKTILFKLICGLLPYDSGSILVKNQRVGDEIDIPSDIGIIIETPGFLPYLSGFQNLYQLAAIQNKINKERIAQVLDLVGLSHACHDKVATYSLGMKQRLGIAQAVMEFPNILILDEPFNGLDKTAISSMRNFILSLKKEGITILLASHQAQDIDILCDEVYELCDKKLIQIR